MKQLRISGQEVVAKDDLALTISGPDLAELRSGAAYSNTVTLPFCPENDRALAGVRVLNRQIFAHQYFAELLDGGVDSLAGSGLAKVEGVTADGYRVSLRGAAFSFFDFARRFSLHEITGLSAWDFDYISSEIFARTGAGEEVAFPVVDYGRQTTAQYVIVADPEKTVIAYPVVRIAPVLAKVVEEFGYTLVQEPDLASWQKLAIPFNKSVAKQPVRYFEANAANYTKGAVSLASGSDAIAVGPTQYRYVFLGSLANINRDTFYYSIGNNLGSQSITLISGLIADITLSVMVVPIGGIPGPIPIDDHTIFVELTPSGTINFPAINDILTGEWELAAATGLDVYLVLTINAATPSVIAYNIPLLSGNGSISPRGILDREGYRFTPEIVLPNWSCADFIRGCLIHAGAFLAVDEINKQVAVVSATQIDSLGSAAVDWSSKFVRSGGFDVDFMGFSATNWLRFDKDSDVPEMLGDGSFAVATGTSDSADYLKSPFSPSKRTQLLGYSVVQCLHWQLNSEGTAWQEYSTDTVRLVALHSPGGQLTFRVGSNTTTVSPTIAVFQDWYNTGAADATLQFSAASQYTAIAGWANSARKFTAEVLLSNYDVQALSLMQENNGVFTTGILRPVFLHQLASVCLILSVSEWVDAYTPCTVTLLKIV